jgi:signal peptidase II
MVAGGALGNIYDRFFRGGEVVDFLQFNFYFLRGFLPFENTRYPAFNIADSAICIGVALLLITWSRSAKNEGDASA